MVLNNHDMAIDHPEKKESLSYHHPTKVYLCGRKHVEKKTFTIYDYIYNIHKQSHQDRIM